ncbi:energy-coupling factor ABC transporter permease [Aminipila butyrica]|uniref:Cobalt transport protein CbiM n=2 Tax=Aminipila butyrica TaxID=433296 RepID=A0A858BXV7_9FIRM|nr:energy-coupling factor ABC transporter permease [Aminipila butyrica]QIB70803.1 energy-coupling factor ABC transporter permease [Aminipila butyrica]
MTMKEKKLILGTAVAALFLGIAPSASAMHIMEGYLPPTFCIVWGVICLPFLVAGFLSIKRTLADNRRNITMIAMAAAFVFVLSSLKIPSVTGSCSHMTGTGLGAILLGPSAVSILGIIVLIFQAILLAHGGLTTLGANTFSMAIAGPFVSFGIYALCKKLKVNKSVGIFLAASIGDLFTYCVTSFQLTMAYPSPTGGYMASLLKFLAVFAPTQVPLAIIEGILTVVIVMGLETYAKPELNALKFAVGGDTK